MVSQSEEKTALIYMHSMADPELNLGGWGAGGPKGRGAGTGWVPPPVGGDSGGGLPLENYEKMVQNGEIWSIDKAS